MKGIILFQFLSISSLVIGYSSQGVTGNCPCPFNYDPVCGIDGRTYPNSCSAQCVWMPVRCSGECPCSCPCPYTYFPVCGIDGRTYPNSCVAHCNGIYWYWPGECSRRNVY